MLAGCQCWPAALERNSSKPQQLLLTFAYLKWRPFLVWRFPGACSALLIITLRWWTELSIFNVQILFSKASFLALLCYCLRFTIFQRIPHIIHMISIRSSSVKIRKLLHLIWRQFSNRSTWAGERDVRWKSSFDMKDVKVVQGRSIRKIAVIFLIP